VLGDLALDVVVTAAQALASGTDVAGTVSFRQGGSAATTSKVLAALGVRTTLVTAVGRDPTGRALVRDVAASGVVVRAVHVPTSRTARIAVVVSGGERSFVADRAAADGLAAGELRDAWLAGAGALHLPAYSLLAEPLAGAARRAVELVRAGGGVVSVDLASVGPLLAGGRRPARRLITETAPDLLLATSAESAALLGRTDPAALVELAPVAVVKRGSAGATVLTRRQDGPRGSVIRFDVATRPLPPGDPTGAGDAFDAGFLAVWVAAPAAARASVALLRRAAVAGNQAAGRYLARPRRELPLW